MFLTREYVKNRSAKSLKWRNIIENKALRRIQLGTPNLVLGVIRKKRLSPMLAGDGEVEIGGTPRLVAGAENEKMAVPPMWDKHPRGG